MGTKAELKMSTIKTAEVMIANPAVKLTFKPFFGDLVHAYDKKELAPLTCPYRYCPFYSN